MGILLGFAPFIVFALLTSVSVSLALWAAFAAAFVNTIRDFVQSPTVRVLDAGSMTLFGLLALYAGFIQPGITIQAVRLVVDGGLLVIAIASLAIRTPFTLQYAKEQVPEELWTTPLFLRTNYVITGVWTAAFAVMTAADASATFHRMLPLSLDVAAGLAATAGAIVFTARYPVYVRSHAGELSKQT
jgi:hypothetical protein